MISNYLLRKSAPLTQSLVISIKESVVMDENGDHSLVSLDPNSTVLKTGHSSLKAIPLKVQKLYEIMEDTIFLVSGIFHL